MNTRTKRLSFKELQELHCLQYEIEEGAEKLNRFDKFSKDGTKYLKVAFEKFDFFIKKTLSKREFDEFYLRSLGEIWCLLEDLYSERSRRSENYERNFLSDFLLKFRSFLEKYTTENGYDFNSVYAWDVENEQ